MPTIRELITLIETTCLTEDTDPNIVFHGTDTIEKARSIVVNGLMSDQKSRFKGKLAPLKGKSYFSTSLRYVIEGYCFPEGRSNTLGYVLFFDRQEILDAASDEDAIGLFLEKNVSTREGQIVINQIPRDQAGLVQKLLGLATADELNAMFLSPRSRRDLFLATIAFGRRVHSMLTDEEHQIVMNHDWHGRFTSSDVIKPVQCWEIARSDIRNLSWDCSNFDEIANRIA